MRFKNALIMILAICMLLTLFAACGAKENGETPSEKPSNTVSDSPDDGTDDTFDEIVEFSFWLNDSGTMSQIDSIEAAMNEILERDYGVHVNFVPIAVSDYGSQLALAIANGESVDLARNLYFPAASWMTFYSSNAMMDMSDLLDEYGQDIKELFGEELLNSYKVGDAQYGIPNYRLLNSNVYLYFRTDVLTDTGTLEMFQNLKSWSEYEELLAILAAESGMYAIGGQGSRESVLYNAFEFEGDSFDVNVWDTLGDTMHIIWTDQQGNVENAFARETIIAKYAMIADWYQKGYVYPDSMLGQEDPAMLIGQGVFAGHCTQSEFGVESTKYQQTGGVECTALGLAPEFVSTARCQSVGCFIPATAKEPEAAMIFLNALYTNKELMTLMTWGIEGENYVMNDGVADYPEGKDGSTCGYHVSDFSIGNQFLPPPWAGSPGGAQFRELALENLLSAPKSVYLGLTVDVSEHGTLVSNLSAVRAEYYSQFANGMYTESLYGEFLSKLEAAGVSEFVGLYQAAVSEFIA